LISNGGQRAIKRPQQIVELTHGRALVDMRIPTDKSECADTRAVRPREKARGGARRLGEIGANALDAGQCKRRTVGHRGVGIAGAAERGQPNPRLERDRKLRVRMLIKVQQAGLGVVARGQQPLRHP